jgi:predicted AAA+ superfamily ATPase
MKKSKSKKKKIKINPGRLPADLVDDLLAMNPWWHGDSTKKIPETKRQTYEFLFDRLVNGRCPIVALRGPRQTGKTTLQHQMIRDLLGEKYSVTPKQIFRIQFDNLKLHTLDDPIVAIINWYENNILKETFNNLAYKNKKIYIFLDEIQDVSNWSAQLKHIVDIRSCHVFITGSSALRIFHGRESLAGRAYWYELNTLGLSEICRFHKMGTLNTYTTEIDYCKMRTKQFWIDFKNWSLDEQLLDNVYQKFCDLGGYPYCHTDTNVSLQKTNEYLSKIVVARTIDHDLKANFELEYKDQIGAMNPTLLGNVFKTFCKYSGMAVGLNRLHEEFRLGFSENLNDKQIQMLLDFFDHSLLLKVIKPIEHRLKHAKNEVKICLCDHAIRRALLREDVTLYGKGANADIAGHIVEGIVGNFLASIMDTGLSYFPSGNGKNNNEVDFVLEIGLGHIPIEVKYKEKPDINSGIEAFINKPANNAPFGLVITKNEVPLNYFKNENIIPISVKKLLLLK